MQVQEMPSCVISVFFNPHRAPLLRGTPSLEMMQTHAHDFGTNWDKRHHAPFRFHFAIRQHVALWTVALLIMFSGYEILFWLLISLFGMIGLLEFYRMLDHKGLPNFKITGMICGAVMLAGSFYYFSKIGPAGSYDFEVAVLLFFLLTVFGRQMFARLRDDEPLQTMAYTLFGLLYVLWLFNFITKIVYLTPRSSTGQLTGQFYVLYLIAVTKFATWARISRAARSAGI